jgi:hypothetical protein
MPIPDRLLTAYSLIATRLLLAPRCSLFAQEFFMT